MGGCCCSSSKGDELHRAPQYYYFPRASEEHVPLSSNDGGISEGLLVDTNLDTSTPDAYRPPPAPMPFDAAVGPVRTQECAQHSSGEKCCGAAPRRVSDSITSDVNDQETSATCEVTKKSDCKFGDIIELDSAKEVEIERTKSVEHLDLVLEEEEDCPICLEEYDSDNPKFTTKCEHAFHLACILQWMERSEICPVCDKEITLSLG